MDPNTWAIIGVVVAMVTLNHAMLGRTLRSETKRLEELVTSVDNKAEARATSLEKRLNDRIDGLEKRLDDRIDGLEKRLSDKIDGVDARSEVRDDGLAQVIMVQFGAVDKRLGAVEEDMLLVKAHLLGVDRAS